MPITNVGNGILMVLKPGISINVPLNLASQNGRTADDNAKSIQWTRAEGYCYRYLRIFKTRDTPKSIGDYELARFYKAIQMQWRALQSSRLGPLHHPASCLVA